MEDTIAVLEKGKTQEIRIRRTHWKGRDYIDVRLFISKDATGERIPTRKGITLPPDLLPDLIDALEAARSKTS